MNTQFSEYGLWSSCEAGVPRGLGSEAEGERKKIGVAH